MMTWEQKKMALESLCGRLHLLVFDDGRIYASAYAEVGGDGFLKGTAASAATLSEAIEKVWENCTSIADDEHLYVSTSASRNGGKRVRWNGFMWAEAT